MTAQDWRQPHALAWYPAGSTTLKAEIMHRIGNVCKVQVFVSHKDFFGTPVTGSYVTTCSAGKLKRRVE